MHIIVSINLNKGAIKRTVKIKNRNKSYMLSYEEVNFRKLKEICYFSNLSAQFNRFNMKIFINHGEMK